MSLAYPSKDVVLAAAQGLDPESDASLQAVCDRLTAQGYAISVMAAGNGQPSDHKVWWQGQAWTFRSSDHYMPGSYRWDPYVQVPYDGSGYSACGIPNSAKQGCPAWWHPAPTPQPDPAPVPAPVPVPAPPPPPAPAPAPVVPSAPVIPPNTPSWLAWTERIVAWLAKLYPSK